MKKKITVGVLYYLKEQKYIKHEYCVPIQLGFHETNTDMGIQKDNEGDNRSLKHPLYSEYSGVYWIWKNINADYKGMMHHRRAFTLKNVSLTYKFKIIIKWCIIFIKNIFLHSTFMYTDRIECISNEEFEKLRKDFLDKIPYYINKNYELLVPKPYHLCWTNIQEFFDSTVNRVMLKKVDTIIKEKYPSYYIYYIKSLKNNILYYSNMCIMKNKYYEEYNKFIFGVFDQLEKELLEEGYYINTTKEKSLYRIFGYLGEMLTHTFIIKKKTEGVKIKEFTMLFNKSLQGNESIDVRTLKL